MKERRDRTYVIFYALLRAYAYTTHTHTHEVPCSWLKASQQLFFSRNLFFFPPSLWVCTWAPDSFNCFPYRTSACDTLGILITPKISKSEDMMCPHSFFSPTTVRFIRLSAVSRQERFGRRCCSAATKMLQLVSELCAWGFSGFQRIHVVLNNFNVTVDSVWRI